MRTHTHRPRVALVVAVSIGALLAGSACAGSAGSEAGDAAASTQPSGSPAVAGSDPASPGDPAAEPDSAADSPEPADAGGPPVSAEALTGGREATELPAQWPSEIPLPAGAAILEAAQPPGSTGTEFYLYVRVAGELADTVRALAGRFDEAGFGAPQVQLSEATGGLVARGHGYQVAVDGRVSDDNTAVLDLAYRVTAAG